MDFQQRLVQREGARRRVLCESLTQLLTDARDYALTYQVQRSALAYRLPPPLVEALRRSTRRQVGRACLYLLGLDNPSILTPPLLDHMQPFTPREARSIILAIEGKAIDCEDAEEVVDESLDALSLGLKVVTQ